MPLLKISQEAKSDLRRIYEYIKNDSPEMARLHNRQFLQRCRSLAEFPEIGRERNDILEGIRSFPIGEYIVLYRVSPDRSAVEIARVFHGKRDYPSLFPE